MDKEEGGSCVTEDHVRMHKPREVWVEVSNSLQFKTRVLKI
jgi:hypothetical protein